MIKIEIAYLPPATNGCMMAIFNPGKLFTGEHT